MSDKSNMIVENLRRKIEGFQPSADQAQAGTVLEVADGIARISGLDDVRSMEMVEFATRAGKTVTGLALNLEETNVGAVIMGDTTQVVEGDKVKTTGRLLEVPIGQELVGRVVNPLGEPIDNKGPLNTNKTGLLLVLSVENQLTHLFKLALKLSTA